MTNVYDLYRQNKIESGLIFQDFVVDTVQQILGISIVQYASRFYQIQVGESRQGFEIKHDEKYATTGRLWIEIAEKARPRAGDYVPSGIDRDDNTWIYIIGDYDTLFLFAKKTLKALRNTGRYPIRENNTRTSRGFLLADRLARAFAEKVLTPNAAVKVTEGVRHHEALGRLLHWEAMRNPAQASFIDDLLKPYEDPPS